MFEFNADSSPAFLAFIDHPGQSEGAGLTSSDKAVSFWVNMSAAYLRPESPVKCLTAHGSVRGTERGIHSAVRDTTGTLQALTQRYHEEMPFRPQ